jgi:hypothetical protein
MWAMPVESAGGVRKGDAEDLVLVVVLQRQQLRARLHVAPEPRARVQFGDVLRRGSVQSHVDPRLSAESASSAFYCYYRSP